MIIATNVETSSSPAYTFSASGVTYAVEAGVIVSAEGSWDAIYSNNEGSESIINAGTIDGGSAISLSGNSSIILNDASGIMMGEDGIGIFGSTNDVDNLGAIFTSSAGIYIYGDTNDVFNTGSITSMIGVSLSGADDYLDNTGRITGSTHAIYSSSGSELFIRNFGTIDGNIAIKGVDTRIRNHGEILGNVKLGGGTNWFSDVGGYVDGTITGGAGDDTIIAGSNAETIAGGGGHDQLYAGSGADIFEFSSILAADAVNVYGFDVSKDTLQLSQSVYTALAVGANPVLSIATAATSASDHLFYKQATGGLFYDPDGNGPQAADKIANIGAGLNLTAHNFTVV